MPRECPVISVGQCGIQFGNVLWRQYAAQHDIQRDGEMKTNLGDNTLDHYFQETGAGRYVPRSLHVDLEPGVIQATKRSSWGGFFNDDFMVDAPEDAANNFARGHYSVGKDNLDKTMQKIRLLAERCERIDRFILNHAVGGGTGSGLGMLIMERLTCDFRKILKVSVDVFPSPNISTCIVEPYNTILTSNLLIDFCELSIIFDNEATYRVCQKHLNIKRPSYHNLNQIMSKVVAGTRHGDDICPFPRLHFMTTSMAPIFPAAEAAQNAACGFSITELSSKVINPKTFCVLYPEFDAVTDLYMATSLDYRGGFDPRSVNSTLDWIKSSGKMNFVEWAPGGFKVTLTEKPLLSIDGDDCGFSPKQVFMLGNNVAVNRVTIGRMRTKFDAMYSQRAYVHWYVGEGMEEGEFTEARENLDFLKKDYEEAVAEMNTEDEGDEYEL